MVSAGADSEVDCRGTRHQISRGDRLKQLRAFCHTARLGSISSGGQVRLLEPAGRFSTGARRLRASSGFPCSNEKGRAFPSPQPGRPALRCGAAGGRGNGPDARHVRRAAPGRDYRESFRLRRGGRPPRTSFSRYLESVPGTIPRAPGEGEDSAPGVSGWTGCVPTRWTSSFGAMDLPAARSLVPLHVSASRHIPHHPRGSRARRARIGGDCRGWRSTPRSRRVAGGLRSGGPRIMVVRQHRVAIDVVLEVDGWGVIKRYVEAGDRNRDRPRSSV